MKRMISRIVLSLIPLVTGMFAIPQTAQADGGGVTITLKIPTPLRESPNFRQTQQDVRDLTGLELPNEPLSYNQDKNIYTYRISGNLTVREDTAKNKRPSSVIIAHLFELWHSDKSVDPPLTIEGIDSNDTTFKCQDSSCWHPQLSLRAKQLLSLNALKASDLKSGFGSKTYDNGAQRGDSDAVMSIRRGWTHHHGGNMEEPGAKSLKVKEVPAPESNHFEQLIRANAAATGMDNPRILRAWVQGNTRFSENNPMGLSLATAQDAARKLHWKTIPTAKDLQDPRNNINLGAKVLSDLLEEFHGDIDRVIVAYRLGRGYALHNWDENKSKLLNDDRVRSLRQAIHESLNGKPQHPPKLPEEEHTISSFGASLYHQIRKHLPGEVVQWYHTVRQKVAECRKKCRQIVGENWLVALTHCVINYESSGKLYAASKTGAKGLMQLTRGTAKELGVVGIDENGDKFDNRFDPEENIRGGVEYLNKMLLKFGGNFPWAVAAYNAGPATAMDWANGSGQIEDEEVWDYVKKVCRKYEQITGQATHYMDYAPDFAQKKPQAGPSRAIPGAVARPAVHL